MFLQYVPFCNLFETKYFLLYIGAVNAYRSINNIVTCPKECMRELDRARRAAMSPEQKALINKRRHELYAVKMHPSMLQENCK
jgi:hypothetical protein